MSRRCRQRLSKWDTTLELARAFGHGTPMPSDEDEDLTPEYWDDAPTPDNRIPIGPLDVRPQKHESRT